MRMPPENPNQDIDRMREDGEEIPISEWQHFLDGFSLNHDGWIADVEVATIDGSSKVAVQNKAFGGISADLANIDSRVTIAFDEDPMEHVAINISGPRRILLTGPTADDLVIEAMDGTRTMLRFVEARNPGKPSGMSDAA